MTISSKPIYYDTLNPYKVIPYNGIQYTVCRDFNHISRYKGLRQVVYNASEKDRFIVLETPNSTESKASYRYYTVPKIEQNRLDLIANKFYGSSSYSWIISYMNGIEDGYTVYSGQRIKILNNFSDLFSKGELLASIPAMTLNLGNE
jgi:hypothetical protein